MHSFEVHSNESAYRKKVCLGLEQVTYSDACWGSQLGNQVPDGTEVEIFKFRSLSGFIVLRSGGPLSWKTV